MTLLITTTPVVASSVENPSTRLWDCCQNEPAGVISFDDGAVLACTSCLFTVPTRRRHPLPSPPVNEEQVHPIGTMIRHLGTGLEAEVTAIGDGKVYLATRSGRYAHQNWSLDEAEVVSFWSRINTNPAQ